MAIYRVSANYISRSQGKSSVASAAYRSGEKLQDERLGTTNDYSRKKGVIHSEILIPENAPERFKDRNTLWNEVEEKENRKDSQLAKEYQFALPKELSPQENQELIFDFCQKEFVNEGFIADISIHDEDKGNGNFHAHVMLTTRPASENGFDSKPREGKYSWQNRHNHLEEIRKGWAGHVNERLPEGVEKIDHRSKAAIEADKLKLSENEVTDSFIEATEPAHKSLAAHHMAKKGQETWQGERQSRRKGLFEGFKKRLQARRQEQEKLKAKAEKKEAQEKAKAQKQEEKQRRAELKAREKEQKQKEKEKQLKEKFNESLFNSKSAKEAFKAQDWEKFAEAHNKEARKFKQPEKTAKELAESVRQSQEKRKAEQKQQQPEKVVDSQEQQEKKRTRTERQPRDPSQSRRKVRQRTIDRENQEKQKRGMSREAREQRDKQKDRGLER